MAGKHSMMVRSDARAQSMTTQQSVRVSARWQGTPAGKRGKAETSVCVSYFRAPDGTKRNGSIFTPKRKPTATKVRQYREDRNAARLALLARVGNASDVD